jgi:hypothetical protein
MAEADTIALKSLNFPDRFVRHAQFLGELTPVVSDLDRLDATFHLASGLTDGDSPDLVSFNSRNLGGYYLRHEDFRIRLHEQDRGFAGPGDVMPPERLAAQKLFREDATFIRESGLATSGDDDDRVSFRSLNYPERHLRHRGFHLYVEPIADDEAKKDATFQIVKGFVPAIRI